MKKQIFISTIIIIFLLIFWKGNNSNIYAQIISGGERHSLYVCPNENVMGWGTNQSGQLGLGATTSSIVSTQLNSLNSIKRVAAGEYFSLFLNSDGTVWACGSNSSGQLGDGTITDSSIPIKINSLSGITAIAAGNYYSLFLKNDGTVWACGNNLFGQLGDGTTISKTTPIKINSLNGIVAISSKCNHSLFLKNDGTVWACGNNTYGRLGDGTTNNKLTPIKINSLSGIIDISAGYGHSFFLKNDGTLWACGNNTYGQLGDGTLSDFHIPIQINSLTGIISMKAGDRHSIFLKKDGTVWTCGLNYNGELGDGSTTNRATPIKINSLSGIIDISAGYNNSFFLKNDGTVWACGWNYYNQIGDGTTIDRTTPVQISVPCGCNVTAEAGANQTVCFGASVTLSATGGTSYQWSDGIKQGVSFTPSSTKTYTVTVTDANNCTAKDSVIVYVNSLPSAEAGLNQTVLTNENCTLSATGGVSYQWSDGVMQGVPFKPLVTKIYTVTVTDANNCTATDKASVTVNSIIATGLEHSLFLCGNNTPMIWGVIQYDPNSTLPKLVQLTPEQAGLLKDVTYIAAGRLSSFFQKSDGTIWASGNNSYGQLADGNTTIYRTTPVQITSINGVKAIAAGAHTLFLRNDSTVWVCGGNTTGQFGNGTTSFTPSPIPVQINSLKKIIAVSAGNTFSLFLKDDGTVWACGSNEGGQLGDGTSGINRNTPFQIPSLNGIISIEAGFSNSFFLKDDGTVWACGWNTNGNLGDGTNVSKRLTPVKISSLSNIVSISAEYDHTLFLKNDGTVWACGYNGNGGLGDGTITERNTPVQITSLSGIVSISAGDGHSLFVKNDGTLWVCGWNKFGQIGDGTTENKFVPVQIPVPCGCNLIAQAGANQTVCSGASVILSATGGTSYQWSDGIIQGVPFIPTSTKTYTVTVTDANNCSAKDSVIVYVNSLSKAEAGLNQTVLIGASIVLSASGGVGYKWSDGIEQGVPFKPLAPRIYKVTVTDANNCIATDYVSVTVNNRIAAGDQHSLFLCGDKTPMIWGVIKYDPNSSVPLIIQNTPQKAGTLNDITKIVAGELSSFFQRSDGTVWACGHNDYGQLADGTTVFQNSPVQVTTINGINSIAAGAGHTLFLKNDSTVWACGVNFDGELGNGITIASSIPIQIKSLNGIIAIAAGHTFSLFLKKDGTVWACGDNMNGQLGDGTIVDRSTPFQISTLTGIVGIEAGFNQSFFLKNDGTIWACGFNLSGQLGDGTKINRSIPVQITSLSGIVSISGHDDHTLFLKNDGTVWACGWNLQGQLGDGTTIERDTPIQITTLNGIIAIAAGWDHSLFLKDDGTLWACGWNKYSQLGDGTTTNRTPPVQISDPCGCIISAEAGSNQTVCASSSVILSATGGISYQWSNGVTQGVSFTPTVTITYFVTVTNANNCSAKDSVTVFVNLLPKAEAGIDQTVCAGTSIVLSATGGSSYQWNNGVIQGVPFTPTVSTIYSVTITNSNNCSAADSVTITVNPLPIADAGTDQTICAGESVIFMATGGVNYQWSDGIKQGVPFKPFTTKTYKVTVTDINKCSTTDEVLIIVNPSPSVDFNVTPIEIQPNDTIYFTSVNAKNIDTWKWDFGNGNTSNEKFKTKQLYKDEGKYDIILTVSNLSHCEVEVIKSINVISKSRIWVPSAFTPNGDGSNDILYVLGEMKSMHMEIYDQWGILVFTSDNQQFGWDGKYRGIDQPVGNYTYIIDILKDSGNKVFERGTITLIR